MGIASLGALARSKDELIGVRSDEVRGKKGARGRLRHPELPRMTNRE